MMILALLVIGVTVVPLLFSITALSRSNRIAAMQRQLESLESNLDELRRRVVALQRAQTVQPPRPAPEPAAAPVRPAAPAPRASPPEPAPPPPAAPKIPIDWERWVGIRGAAALGGIALALAGLLFFQYSIQHGLISRSMRVALGIAVGVSCLGGSEWIRRRGFKPASEGLAGAGVVVLYAALWAGSARYQIIPAWIAFVFMALVTAIAGFIAVRRSAPFVAILGLIGGFATPLLLSIERDRPIGLFGYVLLLDVGLIAIGRKQRWPWIGNLALAGTVLLEILWLGTRIGPGELLTALGILAVFAALFVIDRSTAPSAQTGGILIPFLFAAYFASRVDLGPHLWGVAAFALMLGAGASWAALRSAKPEVGVAAAAGNVAILAVWLLRAPATSGRAWEAVVIAVALSLLFHVVFEFNGPAAAAIVAAAGSSFVLLFSSLASPMVAPWAWLAGWLVLGAMLVRQAARATLVPLQIAAPVGVAGALALQHIGHAKDPAFPAAATFIAAAAAVLFLGQVVPFFFRDDDELRRGADHGAAASAALFGLSLLASPLMFALATPIALAAPLLFGVLILLAATRRAEGEWGLLAVAVTVMAHSYWTYGRSERVLEPGAASTGMLFMVASILVFTAWPFVAGPRLASTRWIWRSAAIAGPLWFFPIKRLWTISRGTEAIGLVPVVLGALALAAAFGVRRLRSLDDAPRRTAIVGFSAVAICFASVAIPLQLHKSWITVGWTLEGLGLIWLWRRLDHAGLKWFGLAHLAAAAFRLIPTATLLASYPRSGTPIVNWLLYTYMVPAAAMFGAAWLLARDEASRAKPFEKELYAGGHAVGAIGASLGGILTVFVWINLAIADWFADGPQLTLRFGRAPARDLTVSIAWAIYALILLGFGMARKRIGLRWLSLGFLLVTIAKVFLYDLGELRDLYRVLSLVGLALSLLLVSVLYQKFVFRRRPDETS